MRIKLDIIDDKGEKWSGEVVLSKEGKIKKPTKVKQSSSKGGHKDNLSGRICALKDEADCFKQPKTPEEVRAKLKLEGFHYELDPIRMALLRLVRKKKVRRIEELEGDKKVYKYVNP